MARPARLIRIAFGRSSPRWGALRASKTLARFVELTTPAFGDQLLICKLLNFFLTNGMTPIAYSVLCTTMHCSVTQFSHGGSSPIGHLDRVAQAWISLNHVDSSLLSKEPTDQPNENRDESL
jgi:hypothetical protein